MDRHLGSQWMLPALDDSNREFFTAGALRIQRCNGCQEFQHPPEEICGACQSFDLGSNECSGAGTVESSIIVHHPVHPLLADHLPYTVALVSLDDAPGVNVIGNVVNRPADDVPIGLKVRVVFEELEDPDTGDALKIPQWEAV